MSKIKKVQIYVGAVGSAYVDKTNAQKNYNEAQQNVADIEAIIASGDSIRLKIENAIANAEAAYNGALNLRQLLSNKLIEFVNDKVIYNKLKDIDEKLTLNDTDGINRNGGNITTATNNKANAESQLANLTQILADAAILLEDNKKEVLTRKDEYDAAKEIFDTFIPNSGNTDTNEDKEGSLNERINEIEETINEIENTSEAINNTTTEITEEINGITNGEVPPVNPVDNTVKYWYAGQINPFEGSSVNITVNTDMLTDDEVNTWHTVNYTVIDGVNYLIKGIDSRSTQKTWYVIVPKGLLTPIKADKQTMDTRFVFDKDVYVNQETYVLYTVSNDVVEIIDADTSRLNILMSSSEEIIVPTTVYGYWYIGTEVPTNYTNMNFVTEGFGWRKITNEFSTYTKSNSLISEDIVITTDWDGVDFYVILPQVFACEDAAGTPIFGTPYNTVTIENIAYNVYKDFGIDFSAIVYYNTNQGGGEEPEPQPQPQDQELYWYIGLEQPTAETVIANNLATEYAENIQYTQEEVDSYNATLTGAVHAGDIQTPAVPGQEAIPAQNAVYSFESFNDAESTVKYGDGTAEVINLRDDGATIKVLTNNSTDPNAIDFVGMEFNVNTLDSSAPIQLFSTEGLAQPIWVVVTLVSEAVPGQDAVPGQEAVLYTEETAAAYNATLEGARTVNDVHNTEPSTGWRYIGTALDGYTYDAQEHPITLNPDFEAVTYYIAFPGTLHVKDGLGTDLTNEFTNVGTVTINEVNYNIYTESRDEFGMIIN